MYDSIDSTPPTRLRQDFPHAPDDWDENSAKDMARAEGIDLSPDHLQALKALQQYFARSARPNVRELHDAMDEAFHLKGGMKFLYKLFPGGPVAQGCRLAGLPVPAGALDKSFGSVQ